MELSLSLVLWDTIKLNLETILIVIAISLAVNCAGAYIIKHGETRKLLPDETKEIIKATYKWVDRGLKLVLAYIVIKAVIDLDILNTDVDVSVLRGFLIYTKPALLWFAIQDIVKGICGLFTDGIDEEDDDKEANSAEPSEVVTEQTSAIEQVAEQPTDEPLDRNEEFTEKELEKKQPESDVSQDKTVSEEIVDNLVKDTGAEEKIQGNDVKQNSSNSVAKGVIIVGVLVLIGAWAMHSCAGNSLSDSDVEKSTAGVESTTEKKEYTLEEYLSNCTVVDTETIGRNPNRYIGMDVLIEDKFTIIGSTLSVGFSRTTYPIKIEYDDVAYDLDLNPIGNVLSGDFGFVAGKYMGEECIRAEIIVLYEEGKGSYEQIISQDNLSNNEKTDLTQNSSSVADEDAEWTVNIIASGEPGDLGIGYNTFSAEIPWYINFVFESNVSTASTKASYKIEGSNGMIYTGEMDEDVQNGDVWTLEVPKNTFEAGEDVYISVFINGKEYTGESIWISYN